ncbi:MAG: hypothetical protein KAR20_08935 [Candidatus Heimdallarchaeota archaeon]|nr:hypothetical protein [Candidatus Heimdallarchaeota archaeon]
METVINIIRNYDWESPFTFVMVILVALLFMRKWSIFLLVLLTAVLSWGAQDMIIMNLETKQQILDLPIIFYVVGGVMFIVLTLVSFYKS